MLHALIDAWPILALIALGVALLALVGRDRTADEHDLSDYHDVAPVNPEPRSLRRYEVLDLQAEPGIVWHDAAAKERHDRRWDAPAEPDDILPPAPPGMNAGSPLYAAMLFDTWHGEDPDAVAARWLRELRDEALAGVAR